MHLAQLKLRDFRNYARLDASFIPGFHLFIGQNAQGKTNILEAIYLLATMRSFRGAGGSQLVRHGQKGYFIGAEVVSQGKHAVKIYWSAQERKLSLDGHPMRTLAEYFGTVRAVVFCNEDLQLVRGPASRRRRFVDLLLSQTQPGYLALWQRYTQALRSRNALLKQRPVDAAALDSFTQSLVPLGHQLIKHRQALIPRLSALARLAYRRIAHDAEDLRLEYAPSIKHDFAVELAKQRHRELACRSTMIGPHRDEFPLLLDDRPAAEFASEGQKRSIVIALKMAQAEYLAGLHGSPPILLIDDIMGELDVKRRGGFLPLLERAHQARSQVFMTVTEENWPRELARNVCRWEVKEGKLKAIDTR